MKGTWSSSTILGVLLINLLLYESMSSSVHQSKIIDYNLPFSLADLKSSLASAKNTAFGADNIHNSMLENLPDTALQFTL